MTSLELKVACDAGVLDGRIFVPHTDGPQPAVILFQDGLGLRPALFRVAERFCEGGYRVYVPNMFWRAGAFAPFDASTAFAPGPERDRLMKIITSVSTDGAMADTRALLAFIATQPDVQGAQVGCVGYCLGGRLALTAAGIFPDQIHSAASLHGSRLATDQPDSPHTLAPRTQAELYVGIAEQDHLAGPEATAKLEAAYKDAGVRHQIEIYPGTAHGFVTDDASVHDKPAAERHYQRVLALFARNASTSPRPRS